MRSRERARHGFTLLEVLIVAAIVGILAGLLMGALGDALASAEGLECANNLKQIGLAIRAYACNHEGHLPSSACPSAGQAASRWWLNAVRPYAGKTLLYRCPSDTAPDDVFLDWERPLEDDWLRYRWASYAMNGRMDAAAPHLSQVREPSYTILVCETAPHVVGSDHVHPELWMAMRDLQNVVDHERHGGRSHYLFVDGHVQAMALEETWDPGRVNLWNPLLAPRWCTPMQY